MTIVENSASLTATEVVLGELATGCFSIIDGASGLTVDATTSNVVLSDCVE